jgi:RNA polymerase sigma-70 factor (ECF subfamily)
MVELNAEQHDQFLRLYTEHEPALRAFVRSLLPTREDAREVMQEVAVVLWRKFDQCSRPEEFRKWAFGVARLEVLTWKRDRARDRLMFDEELLGTLAVEAVGMSDRMEAQFAALEDCLAKLPQEQRTLVTAAYAPNARIDRLAGQRGQTAMALYKALHRIRLTLIECTRRALAGEGLK